MAKAVVGNPGKKATSEIETIMNIEDLKEKYTFSQPVLVSYAPNARTVWLKVNQQSFCIDGHQDTQEEADWMRTMLAKAMASVIDECVRPDTHAIH